MEGDARVLFFLHWPWFSCSGYVGMGLFFSYSTSGVILSLHIYIAITLFPPPFLLLLHEYLDTVPNAIQQDLLVNLF